MGTVISLSPSKISVALDDTNREISFSPNLYKSFDHGWAVTLPQLLPAKAGRLDNACKADS